MKTKVCYETHTQCNEDHCGKGPNPMKAEHTPGPWKAQPFDMTSCCRVVPEGNQFFSIAAVSGFNAPEAEANAQLIAAAPELLSQAMKCLDLLHELQRQAHLTGLQREEVVSRCEYLQSAIAKASGKREV